MPKLKADDFQSMTVEEMLTLKSDNVQKFQFILLPLGAYSGTITKVDLPDPEKNNDSFVVYVSNIQLIEADKEEDAEFQVPDDFVLSCRYGRGIGMQALFTEFGDVIDACGELGSFVATSESGIEIAFMSTHKRNKNDPENPFQGLKNVVVA